MHIEIIHAGALTTIQDGGRFGWAHLGVPVSGYMDKDSANLANKMLGNPSGSALLEMTWTGIEFKSHTTCSMAIAGAEFICYLNDETVSTDSVIQLKVGDHFKMGRLVCGVRAYLAFAGSIDVKRVGGSKSTLLVAGIGGLRGKQLKSGDQFKLKKPQQVNEQIKPAWQKLKNQSVRVIRAMPGPEFEAFEPATIQQAYGQAYRLSKNYNRQGFRLASSALTFPESFKMMSSGLVPGSLQVTPDGQTILAMFDAQTTGGYPRILVVNQDQLAQISQVRPGEDVFFHVTRNFS